MISTRFDENSASAIQRGAAAAAVAGAGALTFAVGYFNPSTAGFLPVCPLLALTGFACPGCGITRGLHALLHGDVLGALDYNLLLPGVLFFFGYLFLSLFLVFARGRGLSFKIFTPTVVGVFFALGAIFAVLRNLPYYPFNILYP